MKNPNGYGAIFKLSGKRRKPFAIRLTTGWSDEGKQLTKYIGYYTTRQEAMIALAEYNKNPYSLESNITFSEVYEKWSNEKYDTISKSNVKGYTAGYKACNDLYNIKFVEIKKAHLQGVIDTCGKNYPTLRKIKVFFNQLYRFAMENEICEKDYSEFVDIIKYKDKNPDKIDRSPFGKKEIKTLWEAYKDNEYIQIILMLIYSGVRISELLDLKKENINLDERYFDVIDSKTEAGIRKVPISKKVLTFYENWLNKECEYLLCTKDNKHFNYRNYYDSYWSPLMEQLKMSSHKPHDTRHTCVSLLAQANVNQTIIKLIVGHSGAMNITEKVYTHFEVSKLVEAIDLI